MNTEIQKNEKEINIEWTVFKKKEEKGAYNSIYRQMIDDGLI
jgi:hypothetical protein